MIHSHLKHVDIAGYYQFITFRTHDSTSDFLQRLYHQDIEERKKQLMVDDYLDNSDCGAYLNGEALQLLNEFFKNADQKLYQLICFSIMPNHVHLLIKPLTDLPLVMQRIKGGSSNKLNKLLGRKGAFWDTDYYDKAIRDEKHFQLVYQYIKNNPLKLLAPHDQNRFFGVYEG